MQACDPSRAMPRLAGVIPRFWSARKANRVLLALGLTAALVVEGLVISAGADAAGPAPVVAAIPVSTGARAPLARKPPKGRFIVGDSLTVGVSPSLHSAGFRVDGQVGRQFAVGPGIVRAQGRRLPRNVVVALGTNGAITLSTCRSIVKTAGKHRRVFLVTNRVPRSWQGRNNKVLRQCNRSFKASRVRMIDWYSATRGAPHLLAGDGFHLSSAGRERFARLIDRTVDKHGLR